MADLQWTEEREKRFHADVLLGLPVQVADAEALLQERERLARENARLLEDFAEDYEDARNERDAARLRAERAEAELSALRSTHDGGDR